MYWCLWIKWYNMLMYLPQNKQIKKRLLANYITAFLGASIIIRLCNPLMLGARYV